MVNDLPNFSGAAKLKAKSVKVHTLLGFEGHRNFPSPMGRRRGPRREAWEVEGTGRNW